MHFLCLPSVMRPKNETEVPFSMHRKPFEKKVWLSSPTMHGDELRYITEAYETNWMSTIGHNIDEAERLAREALGSRHAVALSCGTAALHLAVKLAGVRPGQTVLCSDLTFAATVNPVVYENGCPVFVDAEQTTWNMDPAALERAFRLYPDAKTVILVHLYGTPARLDEIRALCQKQGAALIEDAAESMGATYRGRQTGSFGKFGVLSFNGNKIITGSSGGMLLTDDENAAALARKWSTQSRENAPWYQHEDLGYNYRMSNLIAGVVRGQMPYLPAHIEKKRDIYFRYKEGFSGLPVTMNPYDGEVSRPNFWLSCLTVDPAAMCPQTRDATKASYEKIPGKSCPTEILDRLSALNAEGRPLWKPMHMQPLFRENGFVSVRQRAVSEDLFARGLCLPSDIKMTAKEQDAVIGAVWDCFG